MKHRGSPRAFALALLLALCAACGRGGGPAGGAGHKVLVLGFDGMDAARTRSMMERGELPNFARLAHRGGFAALGTTVPPQSPVAWATFSTGRNPGGHDIFDFLSRDPRTYLPALSMADVEEPKRFLRLGSIRIPLSAPEIRNFRRGESFWKVLSDAGVPVTVLRVPVNFPPDRAGRGLSGMGTPDMLGTLGTFSFYTDKPVEKTEETGGRVQEVRLEGETVRAEIQGPENPYREAGEALRVPFTVHVDRASGVAEIRLQGQDRLLRVGQWSPWMRVRFDLLPLVHSTGIVRFYLKGVDPHFELYMSPINIDPEDPALPVSYPEDYARELAERLGLFYTQGMAEDTWALNQGRLDDAAFLQQAEIVFEEARKSLEYELARFRRGLLLCYFSSTDPLQHMFYRYDDPDSPAYDAGRAERYGKVIQETYRRMDALLGQILDRLDGDTTVIVLSDHGFAPFRRAVHLNRWLIRQGYMHLAGSDLDEGKEFFANVDWSRTRAYAMGLNGLYINRRGREARGTVPPEEAGALAAEIAARLKGLVDPRDGTPAVSKVYRAEEVYHGPYADHAPDLIVGYARGYRGSWQTALGAAPAPLMEDNRKAWSGDHCIDPVLVPGVLLSNRRITARSPGLIDMAKTVLDEFHVRPLPGMEGRDVLE